MFVCAERHARDSLQRIGHKPNFVAVGYVYIVRFCVKKPSFLHRAADGLPPWAMANFVCGRSSATRTGYCNTVLCTADSRSSDKRPHFTPAGRGIRCAPRAPHSARVG